MIVKEICKEYDQRTGKYVKVKKQLSVWGKTITQRYKQEIGNEDENKEEDEDNIKDNKKRYSVACSVLDWSLQFFRMSVSTRNQ